jgi:phosphoglycolate phosphatase
MSFKLVVWDFDGTLADSLPAAVGIFNRLAPELGFRPVEDLSAARSLTTRQFLRRHGVSFWRLPGSCAGIAPKPPRRRTG